MKLYLRCPVCDKVTGWIEGDACVIEENLIIPNQTWPSYIQMSNESVIFVPRGSTLLENNTGFIMACDEHWEQIAQATLTSNIPPRKILAQTGKKPSGVIRGDGWICPAR